MTYEEKCVEHKRLGMAPPMSIEESERVIRRERETIAHSQATIRQAQGDIDCLKKLKQEHYEMIQALLREPSEAMLEAGGELLLDGRIEIEAAKANARGVWRAMLGVAKLGTGG